MTRIAAKGDSESKPTVGPNSCDRDRFWAMMAPAICKMKIIRRSANPINSPLRVSAAYMDRISAGVCGGRMSAERIIGARTSVIAMAAASRARIGMARSPRPGIKNATAEIRANIAPTSMIIGAPASMTGVSGVRKSIASRCPDQQRLQP